MLGHGTTITFDSGFLAKIRSLQWSGIERAVVDDTFFNTTGGKAFEPGDLADPGELVVEIEHNTGDTPPIDSAAETVTITWPDSVNHQATGFMSGYELQTADEEKVIATARIKLSGSINWAAP
jgi:hypothetical protein